VVFPQPDGPRSAKNDPGGTSIETFDTACCDAYRFETLRISRVPPTFFIEFVLSPFIARGVF
jgi:hypothetical protein